MFVIEELQTNFRRTGNYFNDESKLFLLIYQTKKLTHSKIYEIAPKKSDHKRVKTFNNGNPKKKTT